MESVTIPRQQELGAAIHQLIRNYVKDGPKRRSSDYIQVRLDDLEDLYSEFHDSHINILESGLKEDNPYISTTYYENVSEAYVRHKQRMQTDMAKYRPQTSNTKNPNMNPHASSDDQSKSTNTKNDQTHSREISPQREIILEKLIRGQIAAIEVLEHSLNKVDSNEGTERSSHYYGMMITHISLNWEKIAAQHQRIYETQPDLSLLPYEYNTEWFLSIQDRMEDSISFLMEKETFMKRSESKERQQGAATTPLPKVEIPRFHGDYVQWAAFKNMFVEIIDKQNISKINKMWHLKTSVAGEAESLIRHFSLSNENYEAAWKVLEDRYDNPRLQVSGVLHRLLRSQQLVDNPSSNSVKALHDTIKEALLQLQTLSVRTDDWDPLLLHIFLQKLDKTTHTLYEQSLTNSKSLQTIKDFLMFLENRFQSLEALGRCQKRPAVNKALTSAASSSYLNCLVCKEQHPLYSCREFLHMTPEKRLDVLRKHNLCLNCMRSGHTRNNCMSRGCSKCNKRHNTLVHLEESSNHGMDHSQNNTIKTPQAKIKYNKSKDGITLTTLGEKGQQYIILSTAVVNGIGNGKQRSQRRANIQLQSRIGDYTSALEAVILPKILPKHPAQRIDISQWKLPTEIKLADPQFHQPNTIDLLLGAEYFYEFQREGKFNVNDLTTLYNTAFGWIVTGKVQKVDIQSSATCAIADGSEDINTLLEKFWTQEELPFSKHPMSPAEDKCEMHFSQFTQRDDQGRFIVKLPFIDDTKKLGQSREIALRRFTALERKLQKNDELKAQYVSFMNQYLLQGHMEETKIPSTKAPHYYLPHHCVLKPTSSTTKLRVVFDASCKTTTNVSLNDITAKGPTIQDDLFTILLRFRLPRFVFTADIQQMYRQIRIQDEDKHFNLILWRDDPSQVLKCYQLCTVTYGTTCAPYLAVKCLQTLANERTVQYQIGSKILLNDFYVDDVMTGSNSLTTALESQRQLTELLQEGGFKLRKWCANHSKLLQSVPKEDQEIQLDFSNNKEEQIKTLGLTWLPKGDKFCVKTNWNPISNFTKRSVAGDIAHLFDPLGLMGPVIVSAKIFMQQLWELKLDWDAALPIDLQTTWLRFRNGLNKLNNIQIPRHVFTQQETKSIQFHTFADASEKAFGAAVYIRSTTRDGTIVVRLLCAKSKVAPTKKITLPRLELCAAKLAAELTCRVKRDLRVTNATYTYWTDSEIVLAWINSASASYHTFVANRIAAIQETTLAQQWRHVKSKENPADALSRGIAPSNLEKNNLWFYGPLFLHGKESLWPPLYFKENNNIDLEKRKISLPITTNATTNTNIIQHINDGNSVRKLQRIIIRFVHNCRTFDSTKRKVGPLTSEELEGALKIIIKEIQSKEFSKDITHLTNNKEIEKSNSLSSLAPFIDQEGLLRVGGRLEASNLTYDAKHPMLLPYAHPLTKVLMTEIHKQHLHVGPQTLLAITRQKFWPIKGKTTARSVVNNCIICTKIKPKLLTQMMGNLPADRIQSARPFINAGVDFCGPIWIHYKLRAKRSQKTYIAVFCCFATKAVHLEVVSDLTTRSFVGALKRFINRRGHCKNLYCDNATNFIGARNDLKELDSAIYSTNAIEEITNYLISKGINFKLIPPRAPHFGGLWEAAVKSAKHLLKSSAASAELTYEELNTLMTEIEAILNSRPLTTLSADPNDPTALTPGHFLIGEPITAAVDPYAQPLKIKFVKRWELVSRIREEFWKRWSVEYLSQLQQRSKWKKKCENIEPGTIVIVKEDNTPIMKWPLGVIEGTHQGRDGLVRVADVRIGKNTLRRPIHKLAPLPINEVVGGTEMEFQAGHKLPSSPDMDNISNEDGPSKHKRPRHINERD